MRPRSELTDLTGLTAVIRRRRERRKQAAHRRTRTVWGLAGIAFASVGLGVVLLAVSIVAVGIGVYYFYARGLPPPEDIIKVRDQFETTRIYDSTGQTVIYEVVDPDGDRQYIRWPDIPRDLVNATIAIEDKTFFTNPGFDLRGISRAMYLAVTQGAVQGGSTITQQLVKNTLIDPDQRTAFSPDRKIKEVILAGEISRKFSKEQILEWYLNTNFYGNLAYGVDAAAKVYFGKRVQDLSLAEAALLAAIPQNPALNPLDNPTASRQRQQIVLDNMAAQGYITVAEAQAAIEQPLIVQPIDQRFGILAPHFSIYARQQTESILNGLGLDGPRMLLGGGLKIYTTLNLDLQDQVECTSRAYVTRLAGGGASVTPNTSRGTPCVAAQYLAAPPGVDLNVPRNVTNAAAIVLRPDTGTILAMVGSVDYYNAQIQGNFNAALGLRQPASTFKPFVYVSAFAAESSPYTPATMVLDIPSTFNPSGVPYTPRNEDNKFHGPLSIRAALANSYNIPVVRVLADVGVSAVIRQARQLGLSSLVATQEGAGLALALGSGEVTLLDLTYAYSVFANLGVMVGTPVQNERPGFRTLDPTAILRIEDKEGNVLWQYQERTPTFGKANVLREGLAYLINDILSDKAARLPAFGESNALELARPAAVKTGTTNDVRDALTVGYTPQLVVGVWVGNNNNAPLGDDLSGGTAAAPIWRAIMEYQLKDQPILTWPQPSSVREATVCARSGLLPTDDCDKVREIFFDDGFSSTLPTQPDIYWKRVKINSRNGRIATSSTPTELVVERRFFDPPEEAIPWARSVGWPLPPTEFDTATIDDKNRAGRITTPGGLALVRGKVEIRGALDRAKVGTYSLEYGAGINPDQWVKIGGGAPDQRGEGVLLGEWDTSVLDGLYTLRLNLTLANGTLEPSILQVTVDNQAPSVTFTAPEQNASVALTDAVVNFSAEASDNFEIANVEFFYDGKLISRSELAPFTAQWVISDPGVHTFTAIATDRAGNIGQSEALTINVREK